MRQQQRALTLILALASSSASSQPRASSSAERMAAFVAPSSNPSEFYYDAAFPVPTLGKLHDELAELPADAAEVKLRVLCSSVNPSDTSTDGYLKPKPLGSDVVGVVVETDSAVFGVVQSAPSSPILPTRSHLGREPPRSARGGIDWLLPSDPRRMQWEVVRNHQAEGPQGCRQGGRKGGARGAQGGRAAPLAFVELAALAATRPLLALPVSGGAPSGNHTTDTRIS